MDYAAANAANRRFKSAVTRARNKRDYPKVIAVVNEFYAYFESRNWPLPDNWASMEIAREDAKLILRRREEAGPSARAYVS